MDKDSLIPAVFSERRLSCTHGGRPVLHLLDPRVPATAADHEAVNINPGGTCSAPHNPEVIAATAAAHGARATALCHPSCPNKWTGVSINMQRGKPPEGILMPSSQLECAWGGTISIE